MVRPRFSSRLSLVIAAVVAVSHGAIGVARAEEPAAAVPAPVPAAPQPAPTDASSALNRPTLTAAEVTDAPTRAPDVSYGVAARLRWVSVPKWMLDFFTKRNMPLSSYSTAIEVMRRKGEFDIIASFGYMGLAPSDGNWLGKGHDPAIDTDYVQFKNFAMWTADVSFVWHSYLNDWFGLHYGAGLGLGVLTGQMLRTSNAGCNEANAGDPTQCHPLGVTCGPNGCSEQDLQGTMNNVGMDDPANPRRFADSNVPPVLPIVNVLAGIDFRLPHVRGWEAKLEGGFYNAFFLGGAVGYTF